MVENQNLLWLKSIPARSLILAILLIPHTICFLFFDFFPTKLYILVAPFMVAMIFLYSVEKSHPILMKMGSNIIYGMWGPLVVRIVPDFALLGYASHYIALMMMVVFESKQYSLYILLICNLLGWSVSFFTYVPPLVAGTPIPEQLWFFFGTYTNLGLFIFCLFATYLAITILDQERRNLSLLRDKYKKELITLNEDLKKSNITLEQTNKTLQETLAEKESFILRFSHEIRNPLNSLLGNVELCHESSMLCQEDRKMLQDAKISGEILLQLLNNILDSAKISTKRLEINIQLNNIREFCENLWVMYSDMLKKAKLFGTLAVNFNVPKLLEFDELRIKQIMMNLFTNAIKFTRKGFIHIYMDFVEATSASKPMPSDMKPRYYGVVSHESERVLSTNGADDISLQEDPLHRHEVLTLNKTAFRYHKEGVIKEEEQQKIHLKVESHMTRPCKPRGQTFSNSTISRSSVMNNRGRIRSNNPTEFAAREGFLRIEIVDSGCGISEEGLKNAFKRCDSCRLAGLDRQIGTGLGLWITKELTELTGGK